MRSDRRTLLALLAGCLGGSAVAPVAAAPLRQARPIRLLETDLVLSGRAARSIGTLTPGARLELRRAPADAWDPRTVQVWSASRLLGRIAPVDGKTLAGLMDAGVPAQARAVRVQNHPIRPRVRIEVFVDVG